MNLMTFAKNLKPDSSQADFVEMIKKVIDFQEVKNLNDPEIQNLHDAVQFLSDYLLLLKEFHGQTKKQNDHPLVVYNGPFIENQINRPSGQKPDFSYLETFGI